MITISKPTKDGDIPTLQLNVKMKKDTPATPNDIASSLLVTLNDQVKDPVNLRLGAGELVQTMNLPGNEKPRWKVFVDTGELQGVREGHPIHINAVVSFAANAEGTRISAGDLFEGNWLLPVIVKEGEKNLLLAYVKVTITKE